MLSEKEIKCLKETKLRNLKRAYAKTVQHADLREQAQQLKNEIQTLENELN